VSLQENLEGKASARKNKKARIYCQDSAKKQPMSDKPEKKPTQLIFNEQTWSSAFLNFISNGFSTIKNGKYYILFLSLLGYLLRSITFTKQIVNEHAVQDAVSNQDSNDDTPALKDDNNSDWGFFCDMKTLSPTANACQAHVGNNFDTPNIKPAAENMQASTTGRLRDDASVSGADRQAVSNADNENPTDLDANPELIVGWDFFDGDDVL